MARGKFINPRFIVVKLIVPVIALTIHGLKLSPYSNGFFPLILTFTYVSPRVINALPKEYSSTPTPYLCRISYPIANIPV
jgi:hypothetical protein